MDEHNSLMHNLSVDYNDALRLLSLSRDWVFVLNRERTILWVNAASVEGLGQPIEQIIGCCFESLLRPDNQPTALNHFVQADDQPRKFSLSLLNHQGEPIRVHWNLIANATHFFLSGSPAAISTHVPPTSQELPFRASFEHAPIGIVHVDMEGRFLRVNRRFCELLGYTYPELLHLTFHDVTPAEDTPNYDLLRRRLLAGISDHEEIDSLQIHKDGTSIWVHMNGRLIRDDLGQPAYFLITLENIQTRQAIESALRESQLRYRIVADNTYDWEYWRRPDQTFEYVSPSVERITGYSPAEFMDDPALFEKIVLPEDRSVFVQHCLDEDRAFQFRVRHKSGATRWVEHISVPIYENGQYLGRRASNRDITERIQASAKIENQQHLLDSVFRAAPGYLYVMDLETQQQIMSNRPQVGPLDASNQPITLQQALAMMHPDDAAAWMAHYAQPPTLPDDEPYTFDFRIQDGAGGWRWVRAREVALKRHPDGSIHQILGIAHDVNAEHEREAALRESEARFRQLFERHQAIKLLIDPTTGQIIDANPAAAQFYGWDVATLRTMQIQAINTLSDAEVRAEMGRAATEQRDFFKFQHRLANGEIRDVEVHSAPVEVSGKTLLYSIIMDVTSLHEAQRALQESQDRFDAFMRNIPMVAYIKDPNGRLLYFNPICARVFGLADREWPSLDSIPLWDTDPTPTTFWETNPIMLNEKTTIVDGETRVWLTQTFPIPDQAGRIFVGGMGVDVTNLKHAEAALLEMALERERRQILGHFIEKASHEFRTPLSVIELGVYALRRFSTEEKQMQHLDRMEQEVFHIVRLVESMARMTSLDSLTDLDTQSIDLPTLLATIRQRFCHTYPQRADYFQLVMTDTRLTIHGDADLLERAILELLTNAHQFSPVDTPIVLEVRRLDGHVIIAVRDMGIGITPDHQRQIFERFFRVDVAHTTRGFGLGLAMVKRILELHNGDIEVESALGDGSEFRMVLPCVD